MHRAQWMWMCCRSSDLLLFSEFEPEEQDPVFQGRGKKTHTQKMEMNNIASRSLVQYSLYTPTHTHTELSL